MMMENLQSDHESSSSSCSSTDSLLHHPWDDPDDEDYWLQKHLFLFDINDISDDEANPATTLQPPLTIHSNTLVTLTNAAAAAQLSSLPSNNRAN